MLLNDRDRSVIEFLELAPSNSFIIQDLFFPSLQTAQRRLNKLYEAKLIKRFRGHISENYIYYTGSKPRQIDHCICLSKLYSYWLRNNIKVLKFKREVMLGKTLRCDAIAALKSKGVLQMYFVEVELSNNSLKDKIKKYEEFYSSGECQDLLGCEPIILFVTNKSIPETVLNYEVMKLEQLDNVKITC